MEEFVLLLLKLPGMQERFVNAGGFRAPGAYFLGTLCLRAVDGGMKLEQGQIWKQGGDYLRIVKWERMAIDYQITNDPMSKEGQRHQVTKKEFCRLIKGAALLEKSPPAVPSSLPPA